MPRMSVIDASFFLFESPDRQVHVGPLIVLDPPKRYRGNFADDLFDRLIKRPVGEPFNYVAHFPRSGFLAKWEKLKSVNTRQHVHRLTAPDNQTIEEYACELYEDLLDISKPLWQFFVIDKKNDPKVYLFSKIHHSLFDGIGLVNLFGKTFSRSAKDSAVSAPWEGRGRVTVSPQSRSLTSAGIGLIRKTASGTPLLMKGAMSAGKMYLDQYLQSAGLRKIGRGMANPFQSSAGYFKVIPEKGRAFSHCTLSLLRMKAIAKKCEVSVNDVFMAIIDAAVSRLLVEDKVKMTRPLVAEMMMATQGEKGQSNSFSPVNIPLGLPKSNVLKRVMEIQRHTQVLKSTVKHLKTETMLMYSMPLNLAPVLLERLKVKTAPAFSDIFVSNPFGMQQQGYLMGATVEAALPISAIVSGHVMNITGVSNADRFHVGIVSLKSSIAASPQLASYIEDEFKALGILAGLDKPKKVIVKTIAKKSAPKTKPAQKEKKPSPVSRKNLSSKSKPRSKRDN
jgi:diacylglycerol O-acyltransferase / wax synthase